MLAPSPRPRNLEAAFRDLGSDRAATRASAVRDVVRHALRSAEVRQRALPVLERALREDGVAAVRSEAAVALADLDGKSALPALLMAVEDEDAHVRQMAIAAVGELGDPRATQRIERALGDRRPEVRYQAVIAYARVVKDDAGAVATALSSALSDEDPAIRYIAMRVAEEHGAGDEPLRDPHLEARARELAGGQDDALAVVSAIYLARLGDEVGRRVVLDVVAERRQTPEAEDEEACVELAGELSLSEAVPSLERRAWGRRRVLRTVLSWGAGDRASCAWHARTALARMGHPRARAEILADLGSWRRETRESAVVAAGRARMADARGALEELGGAVDDALVREALIRLSAG
jgi:HEAT repeat protein